MPIPFRRRKSNREDILSDSYKKIWSKIYVDVSNGLTVA
jgi:hypothetical protein